jgi:Pyruvate/2-oxoacid:ferredoxin oxidoreductase delta subunit
MIQYRLTTEELRLLNSVDIRPKKPRKNNISLKDYYKTSHWRNFRKRLLEDKKCECEICGGARWEKYKRKEGYKKPRVFNIHHKHYTTLHREKRSDVLVLCQSCHKFCHDAEMMSRTRGEIYTTIYQLILDQTPWEYRKRGK